jgi:hypothetical protein
LHELHGEIVNVGKSGNFQEYFIKIPGVSRKQVFFQEFSGPGRLQNQIPGLSWSCTNPVIIIIIINNNRSARVITLHYWIFGKT